jgi:Protein of unknown function (DUF3987)
MDPELPAHLRGPYAKLEGYAARLALLVQLCRHVAGEAAHTAVDARSVTAAAALIEYFQAHLIRVYTCLRSTQADQRAVTALRWIRAHGRACTVRDLQRHRVAGVTRASQGEKLLRDLVDLGAGELRARRLPSGRTLPVFVMHTHTSSRAASSIDRPRPPSGMTCIDVVDQLLYSRRATRTARLYHKHGHDRLYVCAEGSRPCQSRRCAPCARRLTPLPNPSTLAPMYRGVRTL